MGSLYLYKMKINVLMSNISTAVLVLLLECSAVVLHLERHQRASDKSYSPYSHWYHDCDNNNYYMYYKTYMLPSLLSEFINIGSTLLL